MAGGPKLFEESLLHFRNSWLAECVGLERDPLGAARLESAEIVRRHPGVSDRAVLAAAGAVGSDRERAAVLCGLAARGPREYAAGHGRAALHWALGVLGYPLLRDAAAAAPKDAIALLGAHATGAPERTLLYHAAGVVYSARELLATTPRHRVMWLEKWVEPNRLLARRLLRRATEGHPVGVDYALAAWLLLNDAAGPCGRGPPLGRLAEALELGPDDLVAKNGARTGVEELGRAGEADGPRAAAEFLERRGRSELADFGRALGAISAARA
jgi:hypothetical protein